MIQKIAILALFFTIQALVYNIASALSCLVCRLKIERFVLFFGKTILTIHTKYFPITIGCLPSGGYIKYDPDEFSKRSLLVRMLVTLSGPLVTLLCAVFLLGGDPAVRQFTVGFAEIFRGGLAPYEQGLVLIRDFFRVADQSLFLAYGIFATKLTALNLLPLPGLAGVGLPRKNGP